ncbi:MAG: putative rane protein [Pedosphaera sp.]|nr:putative rane protein [Pedosphaera sp.]
MTVNGAIALTIGLGFGVGLRSLTAPAVIAWAARLGWLDLHGTPLAFMGTTLAVVLFSLFAIAEYIGDLMPQIPRRTAPAPLLARIVMGGLCGASLWASAGQSLLEGALLGAIGAVIGAYAGYEARKRLVNRFKIKDAAIAIPEDLIAIALACLLVFLPLAH